MVAHHEGFADADPRRVRTQHVEVGGAQRERFSHSTCLPALCGGQRQRHAGGWAAGCRPPRSPGRPAAPRTNRRPWDAERPAAASATPGCATRSRRRRRAPRRFLRIAGTTLSVAMRRRRECPSELVSAAAFSAVVAVRRAGDRRWREDGSSGSTPPRTSNPPMTRRILARRRLACCPRARRLRQPEAATPQSKMTFFVTSVNPARVAAIWRPGRRRRALPGTGHRGRCRQAHLARLPGDDEQRPAQVNARDRIGTGPWQTSRAS